MRYLHGGKKYGLLHDTFVSVFGIVTLRGLLSVWMVVVVNAFGIQTNVLRQPLFGPIRQTYHKDNQGVRMM